VISSRFGPRMLVDRRQVLAERASDPDGFRS